MHPPPKKYEINLYKLIYLEKMDLGSQSFFFHRLSYIKLDFLIFIFPLQFGFSHIFHVRFALDFTFGVKFSLDLGCSCIQFVH